MFCIILSFIMLLFYGCYLDYIKDLNFILQFFLSLCYAWIGANFSFIGIFLLLHKNRK